MFSREEWLQQLEDKNPQEMAEHIISNLIGYRTMSKWRNDDEANLEYAIRAILQIGFEKYQQDPPWEEDLK